MTADGLPSNHRGALDHLPLLWQHTVLQQRHILSVPAEKTRCFFHTVIRQGSPFICVEIERLRPGDFYARELTLWAGCENVRRREGSYRAITFRVSIVFSTERSGYSRHFHFVADGICSPRLVRTLSTESRIGTCHNFQLLFPHPFARWCKALVLSCVSWSVTLT